MSNGPLGKNELTEARKRMDNLIEHETGIRPKAAPKIWANIMYEHVARWGYSAQQFTRKEQ